MSKELSLLLLTSYDTNMLFFFMYVHLSCVHTINIFFSGHVDSFLVLIFLGGE